MEYVDNIHGTIQIPEHIQSIIETPHFQRLKKISQLGIAYMDRHTRYDHCIGTYHLAAKTLDALENNTKDLKIPDFYKKAVSIAALLHDVGHGPFSHTWERVCCGEYHHEQNAQSCVNPIFDGIGQSLTESKDERVYLKELVKALIMGDSSVLRDKKFCFLFEILNNKHCNIDVDKWDYLQRDYFHLKKIYSFNKNLNFEDVFLNARASSDGAHIEYRYCDFNKIYNIFEARTYFHIKFYQVPFNVCLENILKYVISGSENDLGRIDGMKVKEIRSRDVNWFLQLDDHKIMKLLKELKSPEKTVQLVKCLENRNITEIFPKTDEEKLAVPEHMTVEIQIAYAGEELKKSEKINFYGNKEEKPVIEQKKGFHKSVSFFQIKQ